MGRERGLRQPRVTWESVARGEGVEEKSREEEGREEGREGDGRSASREKEDRSEVSDIVRVFE